MYNKAVFRFDEVQHQKFRGRNIALNNWTCIDRLFFQEFQKRSAYQSTKRKYTGFVCNQINLGAQLRLNEAFFFLNEANAEFVTRECYAIHNTNMRFTGIRFIRTTMSSVPILL